MSTGTKRKTGFQNIETELITKMLEQFVTGSVKTFGDLPQRIKNRDGETQQKKTKRNQKTREFNEKMGEILEKIGAVPAKLKANIAASASANAAARAAANAAARAAANAAARAAASGELHRTMNVMTYNVLHEVIITPVENPDCVKTANKESCVDSIAQIITENATGYNLDFIALQEININTANQWANSMQPALSKKNSNFFTTYEAVGSAMPFVPGYRAGVITLYDKTKYNKDGDSVILELGDSPVKDGRPCLISRFVDKKNEKYRIIVVNAHYPHGLDAQTAASAKIKTELAKIHKDDYENARILLLGDFNFVPNTDMNQIADIFSLPANSLVDYRTDKSMRTCCSRDGNPTRMTVLYDNIFASTGLIEYIYPDTTPQLGRASDHLPVVAIISPYERYPREVKGIGNIGNTCFLNAGTQLLQTMQELWNNNGYSQTYKELMYFWETFDPISHGESSLIPEESKLTPVLQKCGLIGVGKQEDSQEYINGILSRYFEKNSDEKLIENMIQLYKITNNSIYLDLLKNGMNRNIEMNLNHLKLSFIEAYYYFSDTNKTCTYLPKKNNYAILDMLALPIKTDIPDNTNLSIVFSNWLKERETVPENDFDAYMKVDDTITDVFADLDKDPTGKKYRYCTRNIPVLLPKYFVIHLKLFNPDRTKIQTKIKPDDLIFATDKQYKYQPISVVIHSGIFGGGHYVNVSKRMVNGEEKWVYFNDSSTEICNDYEECLAKHPGTPYLILYEKVEERAIDYNNHPMPELQEIFQNYQNIRQRWEVKLRRDSIDVLKVINKYDFPPILGGIESPPPPFSYTMRTNAEIIASLEDFSGMSPRGITRFNYLKGKDPSILTLLQNININLVQLLKKPISDMTNDNVSEYLDIHNMLLQPEIELLYKCNSPTSAEITKPGNNYKMKIITDATSNKIKLEFDNLLTSTLTQLKFEIWIDIKVFTKKLFGLSEDNPQNRYNFYIIVLGAILFAIKYPNYDFNNSTYFDNFKDELYLSGIILVPDSIDIPKYKYIKQQFYTGDAAVPNNYTQWLANANNHVLHVLDDILKPATDLTKLIRVQVTDITKAGTGGPDTWTPPAGFKLQTGAIEKVADLLPAVTGPREIIPASFAGAGTMSDTLNIANNFCNSATYGHLSPALFIYNDNMEMWSSGIYTYQKSYGNGEMRQKRSDSKDDAVNLKNILCDSSITDVTSLTQADIAGKQIRFVLGIPTDTKSTIANGNWETFKGYFKKMVRLIAPKVKYIIYSADKNKKTKVPPETGPDTNRYELGFSTFGRDADAVNEFDLILQDILKIPGTTYEATKREVPTAPAPFTYTALKNAEIIEALGKYAAGDSVYDTLSGKTSSIYTLLPTIGIESFKGKKDELNTMIEFYTATLKQCIGMLYEINNISTITKIDTKGNKITLTYDGQYPTKYEYVGSHSEYGETKKYKYEITLDKRIFTHTPSIFGLNDTDISLRYIFAIIAFGAILFAIQYANANFIDNFNPIIDDIYSSYFASHKAPEHDYVKQQFFTGDIPNNYGNWLTNPNNYVLQIVDEFFKPAGPNKLITVKITDMNAAPPPPAASPFDVTVDHIRGIVRNMGSTCSLDSTLNALYYLPVFRDKVLTDIPPTTEILSGKENDIDSIPVNLSKYFDEYRKTTGLKLVPGTAEQYRTLSQPESYNDYGSPFIAGGNLLVNIFMGVYNVLCKITADCGQTFTITDIGPYMMQNSSPNLSTPIILSQVKKVIGDIFVEGHDNSISSDFSTGFSNNLKMEEIYENNMNSIKNIIPLINVNHKYIIFYNEIYSTFESETVPGPTRPSGVEYDYVGPKYAKLNNKFDEILNINLHTLNSTTNKQLILRTAILKLRDHYAILLRVKNTGDNSIRPWSTLSRLTTPDYNNILHILKSELDNNYYDPCNVTINVEENKDYYILLNDEGTINILEEQQAIKLASRKSILLFYSIEDIAAPGSSGGARNRHIKPNVPANPLLLSATRAKVEKYLLDAGIYTNRYMKYLYGVEDGLFMNIVRKKMGTVRKKAQHVIKNKNRPSRRGSLIVANAK